MTVSVAALYRHPIKSHGRESIEAVRLTEGQTMPWDRRWAVAHEAAKSDGTAWAPCANYSIGSKAPALMAVTAVAHEDTGEVTLTHPDRPPLRFDPDIDAAEFLEWVAPLMPADRAQSAAIHRVPDRGMTDTDYPSVSLLNLASNDAVSTALGMELSPLRWRCNIHLAGMPAWQEMDWLGRTLRIGTAEIRITEPILRCLATTANPATGLRDADTLGALTRTWGHQDFGIYAEVVTSGALRVGDAVEVL